MMKSFFLSTAILLILTTGSVYSQSVDAAEGLRDAKGEQELLRIEKLYLAARVGNDKKTLENILADDFVSTNAEGRTGGKENTLANANTVPGGARLLSQDIDDVRVRVYGKSGIITGRRLIKTEAGERRVRFTHVFVKRSGKWRLIGSHVSAIAAP